MPALQTCAAAARALVDVPGAIAATRLTNAHAKARELITLLTNFVFMIVFFLISFSCFGLL
jgi:hypothetical protein